LVLLVARTGRLAPPDQDPADVQRSAREILARPEFQPQGKGRLERALGWIGDQFAKLFSLFDGGGGGTGVTSKLFSVLVGGCALAAIGFVLWRLARDWPGRRRRVPSPTATLVVDERTTASQWRRLASEAASEGRWREAMRCRYRALVCELDDDDLLTEMPGTTTGEERTELERTAPAASRDFTSATSMFDGAWYGGNEVDASEFDRFAAHERQVSDNVAVKQP
jgi:hypothetical protein